MTSKFGHAMRSAELALAMPLLPRGGKILELGAGDGWQAAILVQHGFVVTPVDIACTTTSTAQFVSITIYDGCTLPFPDDSFDAIYSSNVLEHVKDFDSMQAELARVLKPDGIAVHCVPSTTWRLWTTLGHPLNAIRWVWRSRRRVSPKTAQSQARHITDRYADGGAIGLLRLGLVAPRHGEHGNLLSEHYLFSRQGWKCRFRRTGWTIDWIRPTGLFYSGNELFGLRLPYRIREGLAKFLGSSTCIFVVHPRGATSKA